MVLFYTSEQGKNRIRSDSDSLCNLYTVGCWLSISYCSLVWQHSGPGCEMSVFLAGTVTDISKQLCHVIVYFTTIQYLTSRLIRNGLACFGIGFEKESMITKW